MPSLEDIAYCKIHPSIGIARVGNSPDAYFIGPETPGVEAVPAGGYKDPGDPAEGIPPRIKRQGARFRIYAYDKDDNLIGEVTASDAEIKWTVHLANKKAEWDRFAGTAGEELPLGKRRPPEFWRNKDIEDRDSLIIDPGPRTVSGANQAATFDGGTFRGIDVPLGNLKTDGEGRLIVLGGFGKSGTSKLDAKIVSYANNNFWYDDVSDGPVTARVVLKSGQEITTVKPSWVIVAPPDFAPSVFNLVTLYDVAVDVARRNCLFKPPFEAPPSTPSFTEDIYPIFARLASLQWVQESALRGQSTTVDLRNIELLSDNSPEPQMKEVRERVLQAFRNPHLDANSQEAQEQANDLFIPALSGDDGDATVRAPKTWLTVTKTQYDTLVKWCDGDFIPDWEGEPKSGAVESITPTGLDRAALEVCAGGAFYPGIEASWDLRNPAIYEEPFRLSHAHLSAGDISKRMALPWQADFFECRVNWWPAQRPDDALSYDTYQRLVVLDERLANLNPADSEYQKLLTERDRLWSSRVLWTRGFPLDSPAGDLVMVENWHRLGFVVSKAQEGTLELGGVTQLVERERDKYDGLSMAEYFHILTNIEQYPDFLHKSRELARAFFAQADFDLDANYQPFEYTPEAFDRRMDKIYDEFVLQINEDSWMDSDVFEYPVVVGKQGDLEIRKNKKFLVGRFSDRVVKERLRQMAPFNLVDGAWLQRIQSAGPADEVKSRLFAIWDDEAGNGRVEQNHCNVYDTLLRSLNIYMPSITAKEFIEQDFLPSAFIQPVFQFVVGLSPEEFYPEILGMTLYLEWEATPTMIPIVRLLENRRINAHFYRLHAAIDNITVGHGALAKEAIKLYLAKAADEGGDDAVQKAWERIWRGYVTWATLGSLGMEFSELALIIDHKRIDLSYPMMITHATFKNAAALVAKFRADDKDALSNHLTAQFDEGTRALLDAHDSNGEPAQALVEALADELNFVLQGESLYSPERFAHVELSEATRNLIASDPQDEDLVRLHRLLLLEAYPDEIAEIPKAEPIWFPDPRPHYRGKMIDLIRRKAKAAKPLHRGITKYGNKNLAELFDDPGLLLDTLLDGGLFDKERPRDSKFFTFLDFSGPMYKVFSEEEQDLILDWVESLREPAAVPVPDPIGTPEEFAARMENFIRENAPVASSITRHELYMFPDDGGNMKSVKEWVSDPRGFMGALKRGGWVKPFSSAESQFYKQFVDAGPMASLGSTVATTVRQWIDSGAVIPGESIPLDASLKTASLLATEITPIISFAATRAPVHGEPIVNPAATPHIRRGFAARRQLIGMGCVH